MVQKEARGNIHVSEAAPIKSKNKRRNWRNKLNVFELQVISLESEVKVKPAAGLTQGCRRAPWERRCCFAAPPKTENIYLDKKDKIA